jgi:pimeloyl-ACP methyl ester carboxylesterase
VRTQAQYWYDETWSACAERVIHEGLWQRAESYDARYRRWHYRVAYEQLASSHLDVDSDGQRPFERIERPLLLAAGEGDDRMPIPTWSFVERLAPHLDAPGDTIFFRATGHTVHTERPVALARHILDFLDHHVPPSTR